MTEPLTTDEVLEKIRSNNPVEFSKIGPRTFYGWIVRVLEIQKQEQEQCQQQAKQKFSITQKLKPDGRD